MSEKRGTGCSGFFVFVGIWFAGLSISAYFNYGEAHPWVMLWGFFVGRFASEISDIVDG